MVLLLYRILDGNLTKEDRARERKKLVVIFISVGRRSDQDGRESEMSLPSVLYVGPSAEPGMLLVLCCGLFRLVAASFLAIDIKSAKP